MLFQRGLKIQGIKDKLLTLNESINWIPEYLKNGRFKNGIEGAPDWNISRNRFWASPLPFWKCNKCGHLKVCGGLDEIKQKPKNNYVFIRHGEAENNVLQVVSSRLDSPHRLTQKGKEQIKEAALKLKDTRWDFIYYSPLLRTKESALILSQILGVPNEKVIADERLREIQIEKFEGKSIDEYRQSVGQDDDEKRFEDSDVVESFYSIKKRIGSFIAEMESKYQSLNILVVAHDTIVWMAQSVAGLMDKKQTLALRANRDFAVKNGDYRKISLLLAPHNANYELDLHRPYIDNFGVYCQCGNLMKRVEEVIDCWFESASMPFASNHYPFENAHWLQSGFPADFVAEYVPQTRTWFYYMHVVSTILFDRAPFRNVLTHGTILAEDGQKMSKSKGNFPDPWIMFNKYGVDALRFYLLSSPVMKAEDVNFVEKDLDAVSKKVINRLENILSFYITYTNNKVVPRIERHNILDRWMSSRLSTLLIEVKKSLDNYFLDKATRSIDAFIEDLSVWYIRRSRDRFKSENNNESQEAINMTAFVLLTLSKVIAPIMPFIAEHIYKELKFTSAESIHLEKWPELSDFDRPDEKLLKEMSLVRQYCSEILEQRSRAGIKVRQPLSLAKIFDNPLPNDLTNLIIEETNIKKVEFVSMTDKKGDSAKVFIDTTITPALKKEGMVRELIRAIQDERKQKKLTVRDEVIVFIETDSDSKSVFEEAEEEIMNVTKAVSLVFSANLDIPAKDYGEFSAKIFVQQKS
jgi:isoleucyl-tRNA synthetase